MRGYMVAVAVALVVLMAGCTAPTDSDDDSDANDSTTAAIAGWVVDNSGTGCIEAFLLFPMSPDEVAPHLPEGYAPADLQAVLGTPIPTGTSGAYLTTFTCADSAHNDTLLSGEWGFVVAPPTVAGAGGAMPINFYSAELYTANADLAAHLAAAGVPGSAVAPSVSVDTLPTGSSLADASISDADGVVAAYEVVGPAPAPFTASARFWHHAANGTVYGEYHLDNVPTSQGTATCTLRAGSAIAETLGFTDCTGHGVSGLTLNGATWRSEYVYIPGAWAA